MLRRGDKARYGEHVCTVVKQRGGRVKLLVPSAVPKAGHMYSHRLRLYVKPVWVELNEIKYCGRYLTSNPMRK